MIGNGVTFIGRLTHDPELRKAGETSVCNFTLARNRPMRKDDTENVSDFIDFVAWGKTAELIAERFTKGSVLAVSGTLRTHTYTREQDGGNPVTIKRTEVFVDNVDYNLIRKPESSNSKGVENTKQSVESVDEGYDLPF